MTQAKAKRKTAKHKCNLAGANFRDAVLKAKLCRIRARHAKHVLDATKVYLHHVNWTIQRSRDVWSKSSKSQQVVTMSDSRGTKGTQTIAIWMRAAEYTPPSKSFCQYSRGFDCYNA
jgi:hypothetical protein